MGLDADLRKKHRSFLFIPPGLVLTLALGLGYLFNHLWPRTIQLIQGVPQVIGFFLCFVSAFMLGRNSLKVLSEHNTTADHKGPTLNIVTSGAYHFTRNPLYICLLMVILAFAFLLASVWIFILVPVVFLYLHFFVVLPEEAYLLEKFGQQYQDYKTRVRRWW